MKVNQHFWNKVDIKGPDDCWGWVGGRYSNHYGRFYVNRLPVRAHRFAYEDKVGDIPKGVFVLHKCDNPPCCNPSHLFLGTNRDNMADASKKGRVVGGGGCFIYTKDVIEIRHLAASGVKQSDIAKMFNAPYQDINRIIRKQTYNRSYTRL